MTVLDRAHGRFRMPSLEEATRRFWDRVEVGSAEECWEWQGSRKPEGYGHLSFQGRYNAQAHRIAFELAVGPIPPELFVCHHCDNPPCCNPAHLFLGAPADNSADMRAKGRQRVRRKLSGAVVAEIKRELAEGLTQKQIGERHGVNPGTIGSIKRGETWFPRGPRNEVPA